MNTLLKTLFIGYLLFYSSGVSAFIIPDTVLFEQKLTRYDNTLGLTLKDTRGKVFLTDHYLIFSTRKVKNKFMNFSIRYDQIEKIRRANALVFPNRIKIKTKEGKRYGLGT
ncbi:MAG: GRAM domain-containing protein [Cyclobacteriaceae bacterium]